MLRSSVTAFCARVADGSAAIVVAAILFAAPPQAVAANPTPPVEIKEQGDIFWNTVKDSDEAGDYELYIFAYPTGRFVETAKKRMQELMPAPPKAIDVATTPMDAEYEVTAPGVVHQTPEISSESVGDLTVGTRLMVTGRVVGKNWLRVKSADGSVGFVAESLIAPYVDAKVAAEQAEAERVAKAEAEEQRVAEEQAEAERVAKAKAEEQRIAEEQAEAERVAKAKAEEQRIAEEQAEAERVAKVKARPYFTDCQGCPEMIEVAGGAFTLGSNAHHASAKPAQSVRINYDFAIGRYEVTVAEWRLCHEAGACSHMPAREGLEQRSPALNISWSDAQEYVAWLTAKTGNQYRLPSEAEWEYAARAGSKSGFWWGDATGDAHANCADCGGSWDKAIPALVDAFKPNQFGLYGTSGGVWEWAQDCWSESHAGAQLDGRARDAEACMVRVLRGGSWRNGADYARSSSRFRYDDDVRYITHGLRVVRVEP